MNAPEANSAADESASHLAFWLDEDNSKLVSLVEMLPYAHNFASLIERLIAFERWLKEMPENSPLSEGDWRGVCDLCMLSRIYCDGLNLTAVRVMACRIEAMPLQNVRSTSLAIQLAELRSRVIDSLEGHAFMYIPPSKLGYYDNLCLFGKDVGEKFHDAYNDIQSAGRCYAVREPTATVFHLMRAMEQAVKSLAIGLGMTNVDKEWGKLLSDIDAKI